MMEQTVRLIKSECLRRTARFSLPCFERATRLSLLAICVIVPITMVLSGPPVFAKPAAKVKVCHIPPDDPENFHTITISEKALPAHLAHGDLAAPCDQRLDELCDDGDACTDDVDAVAGTCYDDPRPPVDCNDGNACTMDTCDSETGMCVNAPKDCDDNNNCTIDMCDAITGECVEAPVICSDPGDFCDPQTGNCANPCGGVTCDPIDQCHGPGECRVEVNEQDELVAVCGDGDILASQECDGGAGTCDEEGTCVPNPVVCGDGNIGLGEECDDGNTVSDDGCSDTCQVEVCYGFVCESGNECLGPGECSDINGNPECGEGQPVEDGTPCDEGAGTCQDGICEGVVVPPDICDGVVCTPTDECQGPGTCSDIKGKAVCSEGFPVADGTPCEEGAGTCQEGSCVLTPGICGDGIVQPGLGEQCDDGNIVTGDGCSDTCLVEFCGDGIVQSGLGETCDPPGNTCSLGCVSCPPNDVCTPPANGQCICGEVVCNEGYSGPNCDCSDSDCGGVDCTAEGQTCACGGFIPVCVP